MDGNRIRKIDRNGMISTIAGDGECGYNGDGQLAIHSQLNFPCGLFVTDDEVFIADCFNNRVRMIDRNGIITTIAGNEKDGGFNGDGKLATIASLNGPTSVFKYKNEIYIADRFHHRVRKIDRNGIITTIAGIENNICPDSVFVHNDEVYFTNFNLLYKILPNGMIKTMSGIKDNRRFDEGDMLASQCKLRELQGVCIDDGSQIYIAESDSHCIRKIDQNGMLRRVIGTGQQGYSGDVPFDFSKYPHIGPQKKVLIKPFPCALYDLIIMCMELDSLHKED